MLRHTLPVVAALLLACEPAEDELEVRVYGEAYIEEGIPADVFDDGWALHYDKFLVSLGAVEVAASASSGTALGTQPLQVYDLTEPSKGAGQAVAADMVPVGGYHDVAYLIAPYVESELAPPEPFIASDASAADRALMKEGGFSVYVAGRATKGGVTKTFAWGFATRTRYTACESVAEVESGAPGQVQITIHGDHLFYDDLYSPTPMLLFGLVASADVDADGEISRAELEAVDLRPLANYQVGSTDIADLWHFIEHQTSTIGHIDGEGHCHNTRER